MSGPQRLNIPTGVLTQLGIDLRKVWERHELPEDFEVTITGTRLAGIDIVGVSRRADFFELIVRVRYYDETLGEWRIEQQRLSLSLSLKDSILWDGD